MPAEAPRVLTDEQRAAVHAQEKSLVVRASAGTGKTTTLVARYLRHVTEDGMRPDQILTITFTRKAAAEMKKRIVAELGRHGLREEAQIAETGPIQTIHGFCERVLRECSVDAGLDPDFTILDETESNRRTKAAIRDALGSLADTKLTQELKHRLAGKAKWGDTTPHSLLEGAVNDVLSKLRGTTATLAELREAHVDPDHTVLFWREEVLEATPAAVREAMAATEPGLPFGVRLSQAYKSAKVKTAIKLPSLGAATEAERADRDCARLACGLMQIACRAWENFEAANAADHALDFVELERRTVELLVQSEPALRRLRMQYRAALIDESQDLNPIQHRLIDTLGIEAEMLVGDAQQSIYGFRQADVRLFEERARRTAVRQLSANKRSDQGILRFVDALFSKIWEGSYVPMAEPANEPDAGFDGVELWEQKTKDTAEIALKVSELVAKEGAGNVAVLVRYGAYALDLLARLEALGVPARIAGGSERYYTRLEVRDLANALDALLDPRRDFPLLALLRSPIVGLSLDSIVMLAAGGGVYAKLLRGMDDSGNDERRTTSDGSETTNDERRSDDSRTSSDERRNDEEFTFDDDPSTPPTIHPSTPFPYPIPDDAPKIAEFLAWFRPLSAYADRVPAWELFSAVLSRSPYLNNLAQRVGGVQTIANVRKLLGIAAGMPEASAGEFSRRMREIREIRHHEGDAPAREDEKNLVTILTIHKAKGLEFPVVVVPETHGKIRAMQDVEIDRSGMLTVKFGEGLSVYHAANVQWRKERDQEELYRLLYVALTRARKRLCVVVNPGGPNTTLAGDIPERLEASVTIPPNP